MHEEEKPLKLNHVGIDVSAKVFTVIMDHEGDRTEAFDLPNDAAGHKKLIRMATRNGFHAKVVLEATGVYSLDLALALHRAKRVEVMVANPRAVSQFAGATLRRSKTDSLDAKKSEDIHHLKSTIKQEKVRTPIIFLYFKRWVSPLYFKRWVSPLYCLTVLLRRTTR